MSDYLLMAVAATAVLLAVVLVWLLREHKKLKQAFGQLEDKLQRSHEELAVLCSAAVAVDQHLAANDQRLNGILDQLNTYQQPLVPVASLVNDEPELQGYDAAIQKIRRGADVDELVKDCGMTRDEAVLLIRLHGGSR